MAPKSKVSLDDVNDLVLDVLKRDTIEGEAAEHAEKLVTRTLKKDAKRRESSKHASAVAKPRNTAILDNK